MIKIFIFVLLIFLGGCSNPDVSLHVKNKTSGKILIDGDPISEKVVRTYNFSENEATFYLNIEKGSYNFQFYLLDGKKINKSLNLQSGEAYLSIDLITGENNGFDESH